jgi:hypothetical protein
MSLHHRKSASAQNIRVLRSIAENIDPFAFVAAPGTAARLVTIGPFHPRPDEFFAIGEVVGGSPALLANLSPEGEMFVPNVWEVATSDYPFARLKADHAWNGIGSSVLWDPGGTWAVVVSDEGHGVIAGSATFVGHLRDRLPNGRETVGEIAERLYIGSPESRDADQRLVQMIARIYGEAEAQRVVTALGGP